MRLNASVMCNCFERGRTTEPPVPRGWLRVAEDGDFQYPADLHVEVRRGQSTQFESVVGALEEVFQASVETGNPFRWF